MDTPQCRQCLGTDCVNTSLLVLLLLTTCIVKKFLGNRGIHINETIHIQGRVLHTMGGSGFHAQGHQLAHCQSLWCRTQLYILLRPQWVVCSLKCYTVHVSNPRVRWLLVDDMVSHYIPGKNDSAESGNTKCLLFALTLSSTYTRVWLVCMHEN